jgi:hypothetical protein
MSYVINQNSVITSIYVPNNASFITCGGTNIAPKVGTTWANFQVSSTNFKYIFNSNKFISGGTTPTVRGYSSGGDVPTTIKQFLYNGGNIQYICGQYSLSSPTSANNIMYFDPNANTNITGNATFNNLNSVTFIGSSNAVNCMTFLNTSLGAVDTTKLVIAGTFTQATIGGVNSTGNIALLEVSTIPTWSINTIYIDSDTVINATTTIINSIIVINNIIYVAGACGASSANCLFYSYNTTTKVWVNLLGGNYIGSINVLKKTNSYIAIGGQFTTNFGTATTYNNIVLYTIGGGFTALGTGVEVVPDIADYPSLQVFALEYRVSTNQLWVGGYFTNAGGVLANSIAIYDINTTTWSVIDRNGDNAGTTTKGLLNFSSGTNPGIVYALNICAIDTSAIIIGGSFRTNTTAASPFFSKNIYNLVKITTSTTSGTKRNYTSFNSKSQ